MSDLAFQYIGFGCAFLAALRVADMIIHVVLGYAITRLGLDDYYIIAVDMLAHKRRAEYATFTSTEKAE